MANHILESHLTSYVSPCGTSKQFVLYVEQRMNHRELRAMWRELSLIAEANIELMDMIIERQDAMNYVI